MFDDLRDLFKQGAAIYNTVKEAGKDGSKRVDLIPEPEDASLGGKLRKLLEKGRGSVLMAIAPNGAIELQIGEGRHLKVYHGPTVLGAVDLALEREGLRD